MTDPPVRGLSLTHRLLKFSSLLLVSRLFHFLHLVTRIQFRGSSLPAQGHLPLPNFHISPISLHPDSTHAVKCLQAPYQNLLCR